MNMAQISRLFTACDKVQSNQVKVMHEVRHMRNLSMWGTSGNISRDNTDGVHRVVGMD